LSAERLLSLGTAGVQPTAWWRVERAGYLTGENNLLPLVVGVRRESRRQEGLGIGMEGM